MVEIGVGVGGINLHGDNFWQEKASAFLCWEKEKTTKSYSKGGEREERKIMAAFWKKSKAKKESRSKILRPCFILSGKKRIRLELSVLQHNEREKKKPFMEIANNSHEEAGERNRKPFWHMEANKKKKNCCHCCVLFFLFLEITVCWLNKAERVCHTRSVTKLMIVFPLF